MAVQSTGEGRGTGTEAPLPTNPVRPTRGGRELWVLVFLSGLLVCAATYFTLAGQRATSRNTASTFNARPQGNKALYLLLDKLGYQADRLETNFTSLSEQHGLLIVIEPLRTDRPVSAAEIKAVKRWAERGGTVCWFVGEPARPLDPADPLGGDLAIVTGGDTSLTVAPANSSPYTAHVGSVTVRSAVRLKPGPNAPYHVLFDDGKGAALVVEKPLGKGHLIVAANRNFTTNERVGDADNALFVVNVASLATHNGEQAVLFDEYHHGVGFESDQPQTAGASRFPLPLRLMLWNLAALALVLIYNGNRRFGSPRPLPETGARTGGDYVRAMAKLYRRARAADIALENLYVRFRRDLAHSVDLPADVDTPTLVAQAAPALNREPASLQTLLERCDRIVAGERITETELLRLARELEQMPVLQRRVALAGN